MFDSDEITAIKILVTDGNEIFAFDGELVEANLIAVAGTRRKVERHETVNRILDEESS